MKLLIAFIFGVLVATGAMLYFFPCPERILFYCPETEEYYEEVPA